LATLHTKKPPTRYQHTQSGPHDTTLHLNVIKQRNF